MCVCARARARVRVCVCSLSHPLSAPHRARECRPPPHLRSTDVRPVSADRLPATAAPPSGPAALPLPVRMVGDAARGREPTKRRERTGREDRGGERWQGERRQGERDQGRRVEDGGRDSDLKRDRVSLSEIEPHSGWNSLLHGRAHLPTTETMRDKKTNQPSCQEHQQTKLPRKPTNQAASGGRPEIEEGEG